MTVKSSSNAKQGMRSSKVVTTTNEIERKAVISLKHKEAEGNTTSTVTLL